MAALTSLHDEAIRAKDEAHASILRTRADAHAAEMASLTSHNARHIQQRDEARQELAALKLEIQDRELAAYNRGVVDARTAYDRDFNAGFSGLADRKIGRAHV